MEPYRILSLDGGGTWALIQIMALQQIYSKDATGHEVLRDFDLIAANSGGSITAGGLVTNLPLSEILNYFTDPAMSALIFNPIPFALLRRGKPFRYIFNRVSRKVLRVGAKYRTKQKLSGLEDVLTRSPRIFKTKDDKAITDASYALCQIPDKIRENPDNRGHSPEFLICAFSYDHRRAKFFRSETKNLVTGPQQPDDATLCQAIHASTNAPVNFFVSPARVGHRRYWDGAVAALNNPALAAVTEALAKGIHARRIQVLSLGTGTVSLPPDDKKNSAECEGLLQPRPESTLFGDVAELSTSVLDDPPDMATYVAHVVLSSGRLLSGLGPMEGPFVRMTPLVRPIQVEPRHWALPKTITKDEFTRLVGLDLDATSAEDIALLTKLAEAWIAGDIANQAIHETSDFEADIGERTFADALQHWRNLRMVESYPLRAHASA